MLGMDMVHHVAVCIIIYIHTHIYIHDVYIIYCVRARVCSSVCHVICVHMSLLYIGLTWSDYIVAMVYQKQNEQRLSCGSQSRTAGLDIGQMYRQAISQYFKPHLSCGLKVGESPAQPQPLLSSSHLPFQRPLQASLARPKPSTGKSHAQVDCGGIKPQVLKHEQRNNEKCKHRKHSNVVKIPEPPATCSAIQASFAGCCLSSLAKRPGQSGKIITWLRGA
jgi:hypothetical protein